MKLPLDAVVFDLDDTLFDDTAGSVNAAAYVADLMNQRYGADPATVIAAYVHELEEFWERLTSSSVKERIVGMRAHVWAQALERCGLDVSLGEELALTYDEIRRPSFVLWPGVPEMLERLRKRGSKLAILTNGLRDTHREKIAILGLEPLVDGIYISDEIGMAKPDPRIFQFVCDELSVAPHNATMVGDRYSRDIIGAQEVGMKTIWLNLRNTIVPMGAEPPDAIVMSIQEAAELLVDEPV